MRPLVPASFLASILTCSFSDQARAEPLDLTDASPRVVVADFGFGGPQAAEYSVSGDTANLLLSAESHLQIRPGGFTPVPEAFTPLTIFIDRTDGSATSSVATGAYASGPIGESFVQGPLSTDAIAGYMSGNNLPPLFCASQQVVDDACLMIHPIFCGAICNLVAGADYNPTTGFLRLVGEEDRQGCDGGVCSGPFVYFGTLAPTLSELVPTFVGDAADWSLSRGTLPPLASGSFNVIDPGLEDEILAEEVLGSFDFGPDTLRLTIVLENGHALASELHWEFSDLNPIGAPAGVEITGLTLLGGTGTVVDFDFSEDSLFIVTAQEQAPPNVFTYEFAIEATYVPEPDGTLAGLATLAILYLRKKNARRIG